MYDFGKRIAGLAAFFCVGAALVPLWSPSQTAMQYQLNDNTRQLQLLANVPTEIAVIKEQMADLKHQVAETKDGVESIKTTGQYVLFGLLAWMGKEIFTFLGGKFKRGDDG